MTPEKLEEIRARHARESVQHWVSPPSWSDVAALLAEVDRLKALMPLAQAGLLAHHGHHCEMAGGAYPGSPTECSDAVCRSWASLTKEAS